MLPVLRLWLALSLCFFGVCIVPAGGLGDTSGGAAFLFLKLLDRNGPIRHLLDFQGSFKTGGNFIVEDAGDSGLSKSVIVCKC